jgi:hypothetical protein
MSELEPRETEIDSLLRHSMSAPIPSLSADFEQNLLLEVNRRSQPLNRYGRVLLTGYALLSAVSSAVIMRGQGLEWGATAGMILVPLALIAVASVLRRTIHPVEQGARPS